MDRIEFEQLLQGYEQVRDCNYRHVHTRKEGKMYLDEGVAEVSSAAPLQHQLGKHDGFPSMLEEYILQLTDGNQQECSRIMNQFSDNYSKMIGSLSLHDIERLLKRLDQQK